MDTFHPFSLMHALATATCFAIIATLCFLARKPGQEPTVRKWWLLSIFVIQLGHDLYFMTKQPRDWGDAIPLQVCDLMGWVAAWSLISQRRLAKSVLFFGGLGLCTQAFFTPTLQHGPEHIRFWLFFLTHTQIIGTAVYEFAVRGYRPRWADALTAYGVFVAYACFIVPLDTITGWNYGFLGPSKPAAPTVVDLLGPWPLRILPLSAVVATAFTVVKLGAFAAGRLPIFRSPDLSRSLPETA
jgi:hypothetical protein